MQLVASRLFLLLALALPGAALAEPCVDRSPLRDLGDAVRAAAEFPDERDLPGAVVLANFDGYGPMVEFQERMLKQLSKKIDVILVVPPGSGFGEHFRSVAPDRKITVIETPLDTNWSRDFLPETVIGPDGKARLVQFKYFHPLAQDVGKALAKTLGLPLVQSDIAVEGGNLLRDGENSRLFVTERVLKANPKKTRLELTKSFEKDLGVREVVWLPELPGEYTGHVDMYATLADGNVAVVARAKDPAKKKVLDAAAARFDSLGYRVKRIDVAGKGEGNFFPSYTNVLLAGKTAFVPSYDEIPDSNRKRVFDAADDKAVALWKSLGYTVKPIPAYYLLVQGGAVHCMTKTLPAEAVP